MLEFEFESSMPVSAEDLYEYHARPGAFQRLLPPWERIELAHEAPPIRDHSQLQFFIKKGPFRIRWVAEHYHVIPGQGFQDHQRRGPFKTWIHQHKFIPDGPNKAVLSYLIQVDPPGSFLGRTIAKPMLKKQMYRLFHFRHRRTFHDLTRHAQVQMPRSVLIVGDYPDWCQSFAGFLTTGGHRVYRLHREQGQRFVMRPFFGGTPCHPLEQCDAILLTETPAPDRQEGSQTIAQLDFLIRALKTLGHPPEKLIRVMAKTSRRKEWQQDPQIPNSIRKATETANDAFESRLDQLLAIIPDETRVHLGAVIHPSRKALTRLLLQLETFLFLGEQAQTPEFRWISREDLLGGLLFLIDHPEIQGDVALAHSQTASRAELQRLFLRHFYWHYALGRVFQVVGWSSPGQNPALNEYLRDFPNLQHWGFQCIAEDLAMGLEMEFGIPHSKPGGQVV